MAKPLFDAATIETPEQIELRLPLAGPGSRSLAYLLDLCVQLVPLLFAVAAAFLLVPVDGAEMVGRNATGLPELGSLPLALVSVAIFAVNFGYFALFEAFWNGQSPGKRWIGLRVLRDGGFPIDGRAALLRNLLRLVDFLPAFYVTGVVAIFAGGRGKRIGDYVAGTFVVREGRPLRAEGPAPARPSPASGLSAGELALVRGFLDRRLELDEDARWRLSRQLAARFSAQLGQPVPSDAERFLEGLA